MTPDSQRPLYDPGFATSPLWLRIRNDPFMTPDSQRPNLVQRNRWDFSRRKSILKHLQYVIPWSILQHSWRPKVFQSTCNTAQPWESYLILANVQSLQMFFNTPEAQKYLTILNSGSFASISYYSFLVSQVFFNTCGCNVEV